MQIVWPFDVPTEEVFIISVDGTHCPIQEPRNDPSASWFSHKLGGPGVAYELGVAIRSSRIVWTNGPFKAGTGDHTIFTAEGGLAEKIPAGKKAIADRGYTPGPKLTNRNVATTNVGLRKFKSRVCARHEDANKLFKDFAILTTTFRHPLKKHGTVYEAIAVIAQYEMENGRPLFDI